MEMPRKRSSSSLHSVSGSTAGTGGTGAPASSSNTTMGGTVDNAECWDSISYLESAFHHGFMRSRIKNGDFVYHENPRLTRELDEFCDVDAMHQPKGPIILLGESGVGKSAFLANWLVRRKKMFQNWQTSYPEFIFYHVVGCSRQSCWVSNLLERILREIKEYFELTKDIPDVEERLGWQFPRFLEAASKKGRVILIIDGLQRLRTSDGESILKWVPLAFPPNVRIIFSGTINYPLTTATAIASSSKGDALDTSTGGSSHDFAAAALGSEHHEKANLNAQMIERIKLEANRRKWVSVHVPTLGEDDRKRIIKKFLYKHQPSHVLSSSASESALIQDAGQQLQFQPHGLQLFEIQERAIAAVPMTANPHFLKLFLACLVWATDEGFNIHYLFEHWLSAESIGQLMEAILRSMETGYTPDAQGMADARQFLAENNYCATQQLVHSPIRRKVSATVECATDKQQLLAEIHGTSGSAGNDSSSRTTSPLIASGRPGSSSSTKEYGYHDARIPSRAVIQPEKTITASVIELNDDESLYRRSSMPVNNESGESGVIPSAIARTDSAHETKEVFVRTLRTDAVRSQPHATQEELGLVPSALLSNSGAMSVSAQLQSFAASSPPRKVGLRAGALGSPPKLRHDMHQSQSVRVPPSLARASCATINTPAYLTGGRYVSPLSELLGRALCLLYVCRHGMLTNELRFILNAIVTEEREAATQAMHRKASFSNVKNLEAQSPTAFSECEWKTLLRAMKPLGVLFVQDVVVLPICKEVLREVVWWRYIGSERCEQKYHQWLIRFFRIHPTTFRRVEELPWHLKRCYQWDALRNVLVNLPMFQLLYTANYKHELFGYWRTLTDGPLLLYNASETAAATDAPVYALPLDIVKEYGKSLEEWYKSARPPTKVFTPMVQLVTKFMYEFSLAYQGALPPFQYAPFDLKRLYTDGFSFVEDLPHVQMMSSASAVASTVAASPVAASGTSMAASAAATATSALLTALESFPTLGQSASVANSTTGSSSSTLAALAVREKETGNWFYFYQRWIWIHFPWLALSKEIVIREPYVSPNSVTGGNSSSSGAGSQQSLGGVLTTSISGGMSGSSGLHDASRGVGTDALDPVDEELRREGGSASHTALLAPLHAANSAAGSSAKSIIHFDARFWDVKKSMFESSSASGIPHARKKRGVLSPTKVAALQHASVLGSTVPTTATQDVISPEHVFRKKATYVAVKNVLASSVRRLPTAVASASLPLASVPEHASNNRSSGPTFLTETAAGATGAPSSELESAPSLDIALANASVRPSPAARDLVLEHLSVSDPLTPSLTTAFGLPAHFQDYPQREWDLKQSYNYEVVLKLQTLYDAMKTEVTRKQAHLASVKHKIQDTTKRYALTARECDMAKYAIGEMTARMDKIERMSASIDRQEKNHRKLLRGCELFAACDPSHFDTMKKELRLLTMKLKDLTEERKVLSLKKTHLQSVELPLLRSAIDKSKSLMSAVVEKLERARGKLAHDQAATDKLYQRRLEMLASVRAAPFKSTGESLEAAESAASQLIASVTTRSLAAKVALQQCEAMCEKIQKATGYSKLELILQKFVSREELNKSFEEQGKIYEARLKQIKLHQAELEAQLASLEMSNATATTDDPRVLEERLRIAELELARIERTQNSLLTTSKEVIAGASRVVKLIGLTSCRTPYEHAIPATRLWPPPLASEGDATLASEFETLEPKDIASLLQICQDRASLMIDTVRFDLLRCGCGASLLRPRSHKRLTIERVCGTEQIEGGRGDPDANFSVVRLARYALAPVVASPETHDRDLRVLQQLNAPGKAHARKSLRTDDKALAKTGGRTKKQTTTATANNDKRDRSFDRGSVPAIVYPVGAVSDGVAPSVGGGPGVFILGSLQAPPGSPDAVDEDESGEDPATRESVKASSRSKIVAKKRMAPGGTNGGGNSVGS